MDRDTGAEPQQAGPPSSSGPAPGSGPGAASGPAAGPGPGAPPPAGPGSGTPPQVTSAPGRAVMAGMNSDPRMRVWIRRTVIAVVAGGAIGIWLGPLWGLTAAAIVVILDALYQSRVMSPIPADARAATARRRTRRQLNGLRRSGFLILNARAIPDSDQVIDHLVIGPAGVYAVDSEMWDKRLPIRTTAGGPKTSGVLYHGPFSQAPRLAHARWEAGQAARLIGAELARGQRVTPAMVIYGPDIPWGVATLRGVEVFSGKQVRKFFRKQNRVSRGQHLDPDEINEIYEAAERVLPPLR